MIKDLKIGELSKLFKISTDRIRYLEKKDILYPKYIDTNGYRMYGVKEIYTLSYVLLLRGLNISVKEIKKSMNSFDEEKFIQLLNKSIATIDDEINKLMKLKNTTIDIISKFKIDHFDINSHKIKYIKKRCLKEIFNNENQKFNFEYLQHSLADTGIHNKDVIYIIKDRHFSFNLVNEKGKIILPTGKYLTYTFISKTEDDFKNEISKFNKYLDLNNLKHDGEIIVTENPILSLSISDGVFYELQIFLTE